MGAATVLIIIAVGVAVGLLSGLVGIGGGVLIVPFLYFFYDRPDLFGVLVDPEARTILAHGTSLFVIVPTSIRGALTFHKARLVEWRAVVPIGVVSVLAAIGGARLALVLPPELLKVLFGALLVFAGIRLVLRHRKAGPVETAPEPRLSWPITVGTGVAVGIFSALLGVGGGIIAIPLLIHLVGLDMRRVAATSIGIIALTAAAGSIAYMVNGFGEPGLPPWSVGYVDVATGIAMFIGSVVAVRWGAALNQRLSPRALASVFCGLFVVLGVRLIVLNLGALIGGIQGGLAGFALPLFG